MSPSRLTLGSISSYLTSLVFIASLNSCGMPSNNGEPDAYLNDNGDLWAYGSIQVADLDGPGSLMLKRTAGDQTLDTNASTSKWALVGTLPGGDERDVVYADLHPSLDRLLVYWYQINIEKRAGTQNAYDVYAVLRKAGRSYYQRQRVYVGTATFGVSADVAPMEFADGLKMSLIANGVFAGQWAVHYPDVRKVVVKPWQGMCPKTPTQMPGQSPTQRPGQNPGQNPGQFDICRPLPPEKDLCSGDPTQQGCRPLPPVQQEPATGGGTERPAKTLSGLVDQGNEVYVMNGDVAEAKMVFVSSSTVSGSSEENAELCSKKFYAVARTLNGRVNQACILTPAPASAVAGKAACGLTIRFDQAQTYQERVCDITAVFKDAETQKVQILKK